VKQILSDNPFTSAC